jgi:hypothetical protein
MTSLPHTACVRCETSAGWSSQVHNARRLGATCHASTTRQPLPVLRSSTCTTRGTRHPVTSHGRRAATSRGGDSWSWVGAGHQEARRSTCHQAAAGACHTEASDSHQNERFPCRSSRQPPGAVTQERCSRLPGDSIQPPGAALEQPCSRLQHSSTQPPGGASCCKGAMY